MAHKNSTLLITGQSHNPDMSSSGAASVVVASGPAEVYFEGEQIDPLDLYRGVKLLRRRRTKEANRSSGNGLLSRAEAADYLGVSVRYMEGNSSIPKQDLGRTGNRRRTWRYSKADLDAWIASRPKQGRTGRVD